MDDEITLDPPGTVAVIGGGPIGMEAALYGRFLGYQVTLFEAREIASSWREAVDQPIPMLPDRCASPLALSAIDAQRSQTQSEPLPVTIGEWINRVWLALSETDLVRGRVRCDAAVSMIKHVQPTQEGDAAEEIEGVEDEPDFQITTTAGDVGIFEAVILATGSADGAEQGDPPISFELEEGSQGTVDYLYRIGWGASGDAEADFWDGLKQIVSVYASLRGRADLDLYRPRRG